MSAKTPSATLSTAFTYASNVSTGKRATITQVVIACDTVGHVLKPAATWQVPGSPYLTFQATSLAHQQTLSADNISAVNAIKIATTVKTITVTVTFFGYHKKTKRREHWDKTFSLQNNSQISESQHHLLSIHCDSMRHLSATITLIDPKKLAELEICELRKLFWAAEVRLFRVLTDFTRAMLVPSQTTIKSLPSGQSSEGDRVDLYEQLVEQAKGQITEKATKQLACDPGTCIAIFKRLQTVLKNRGGLSGDQQLEHLGDYTEKQIIANTEWKKLENPSIATLFLPLRGLTLALMQARDAFLDSLQVSVSEDTRKSLQTTLATCKTNHMDLLLKMHSTLQSDPTASIPSFSKPPIAIPKVQEVIPAGDPFSLRTTEDIQHCLKESRCLLRMARRKLQATFEDLKASKEQIEHDQKSVTDWEKECARKEAILLARKIATDAQMDPIILEDPAVRWLLSAEELSALRSIRTQDSEGALPLCIQHFISAYTAMQKGILFMTESNTPFNPFYLLDEMTANTCPESPGFLVKTANHYLQTKNSHSVGKILEQIVSKTQTRLNLYLLEIQQLRI